MRRPPVTAGSARQVPAYRCQRHHLWSPVHEAQEPVTVGVDHDHQENIPRTVWPSEKWGVLEETPRNGADFENRVLTSGRRRPEVRIRGPLFLESISRRVQFFGE